VTIVTSEPPVKPPPSGMRGRRGWSGPIAWLAGLALAATAGFLAGQYVVGTTLEARAEVPPARQTYVITEGTLGRTLRYPGLAEWQPTGTLYAPSSGVVTEVVAASGTFEAGDIVLRLNERPVVLIPGPIPAFRDLTLGDRGRDVAALQDFLATQGYRVPADRAAFTEATRSAVQAWQRSLGLPTSGVVALGDVLFVKPSELDGVPFRWTPAADVGAPIAAGTPILERLAEVPILTIEFGQSPPEQLAEGLRGRALFPAGERLPVVLSMIRTVQGRSSAQLSAPRGRLCNPEVCLGLVAPEGQTEIDVEFTLVPETTGPQVPAIAVQSDVAGQPFVELADGTRQRVEIRVASGGLVVVDGIRVGQEIVLP